MKRLVDIFLASILLIVSLPILILIAVTIRTQLGSPIIYCQKRPGRNCEPFTLIKFRTLSDIHDEHGDELPDEKRMTRLGTFIRSSSLDELPELWNVLKGDMSLVGPRPLLMRYLPYYTEDERKRHQVRPGITGLAQVKGRNYLSWDRRLALDVKYVENQSLGLDFKILWLTLMKVVVGEGIAVNVHDVMQDLDDERRS